MRYCGIPPVWKSLPWRRARRAVAAVDTIIWVSDVAQMNTDYNAEQLERLKRRVGRRVGQPEPPLLVALTHCDRQDPSKLQSNVAARLSVATENIVMLSLADPLTTLASEQAVRSHHWRYLHRQRRAENRELAGSAVAPCFRHCLARRTGVRSPSV